MTHLRASERQPSTASGFRPTRQSAATHALDRPSPDDAIAGCARNAALLSGFDHGVLEPQDCWYTCGSIMSGWALVFLTMSWLLLPWICRSGGQASAHSRRAKPEIHGFLRVLGVLNSAYCLLLASIER